MQTTYVYAPTKQQIDLPLSDMMFHALAEAHDEQRPHTGLPYQFESGYTTKVAAHYYTAFEDGSSLVGATYFDAPVAELLDIDAHFAACQGKVTPLPRLEHLRAERQVLQEAVEDISHTRAKLKELTVLADLLDVDAQLNAACKALVLWEEANLVELEGLEANHYWGARHYEAGGALLHGCPYTEGSNAAQAWASGWTAAQEIAWAPIYAAARKF